MFDNEFHIAIRARMSLNDGNFEKSVHEAGLDQVGYEISEKDEDLISPQDSDKRGYIGRNEKESLLSLEEHISTENLRKGISKS